MSRIVSADMTARWLDQFKIGDQRPVCRAIIQRQNVKKFEYDTAWTQGGQYDTPQHRTGWFTSMIFGDESSYREIPNIQSVNWERSIGQDAATCTITLLNSQMTPIGEPRDNTTNPDEFDKPGYFTFNRGEQTISENRWGYDTETGWNGIYVPDMVVKTFEGYGCDRTVTPFLDPNLVQSGVWLIDDVEYRNDGAITLTMRDLGRLLIADSISFPPIVPRGEYPLRWIKTHSENVPSRDAVGGEWSGKLQGEGTASSSNEVYIGEGLTNAPFDQYVGSTGGVEGHHASHALVGDNDNDLYWRSTGQDDSNDFVWWQFDPTNPMPVAALRIKASGGPYRVYISIDDGGGWVGKRKIGYHLNGIDGSPGNIDIEANIPFVKAIIADRFFALDTNLPEVLEATRVRLTFTRLHQSEVGEHPFRAGLRQLQLYTADSVGDLSYEDGFKLKVIGNYSDFTHIVKWCCAWAGFYWPPSDTNLDFIRIQDGDGDASTGKNFITFAHPDPALPKGRVWGDFMKTGTGGEADLTADMFDKKPLMDCINYVRDLTNFIFFIDEMGGVVWRQPNLGLTPGVAFRLGNYLSPTSVLDPGADFGSPMFRGRYGRTDEIVELDERENLFAYITKLSSQSIRERIFVGNSVGGIGTVIKGFNPYPIGLRRIAGWTDQHFDTKQETKVMADMISARSMFAYRRGQSVIPGYPKIQIDDMVRIFERVTNETYYHYVLSIKSEMDMTEGVWTYTLDTHWLGEEPEDAWIVDVTELSGATQAYLEAVGYEPEDSEDNGSEDPATNLP